MRPRSITLFATAYLVQAAITLVQGIYAGESNNLRIEAYFPASSSGTVVAIIVALRLAIALLLTWLVWARASKFAKWAIVVLFAFRGIRLPEALAGLATPDVNWLLILWFASLPFTLFAVICLFLPESRDWFARKGGSAKADAAVFE